MIRFALKSLAGRKLRTVLTALAIVLGVAMVAYLSSVLQRGSLGIASVEAGERFHVSASLLSTLAVTQLVVYAALQMGVDLFDSSVARLHEVLEGGPLNDLGEVLHPPAPGLRRRLWQATTSDPRRSAPAAAAAARAGDGLQLSRATGWQDAPLRPVPGPELAQRRQAELIQDKAAFREHWVPDLERWFGQGVDTPGLVLIKVRANRIHYWAGEDEGEVPLG